MATLPLLPDSDGKPKLIGIARLAAQGESIREGHKVEYFTLPTRSLLNRVVSNRNLPFTWAINPYRGCEFACKYCYARYTHEFMEMTDEDFEHKIYVKQTLLICCAGNSRRSSAASLSRSAPRRILISPPSAVSKLPAGCSKSSRAIADSKSASSPSRIWSCVTPSCCARRMPQPTLRKRHVTTVNLELARILSRLRRGRTCALKPCAS